MSRAAAARERRLFFGRRIPGGPHACYHVTRPGGKRAQCASCAGLLQAWAGRVADHQRRTFAHGGTLADAGFSSRRPPGTATPRSWRMRLHVTGKGFSAERHWAAARMGVEFLSPHLRAGLLPSAGG